MKMKPPVTSTYELIVADLASERHTSVMRWARAAAMHSDDPDTKVGCVIVSPRVETISGSNNIPDGVYKNTARLVRPEKYDYIQHAEIASICRAAKEGIQLNGASMYLTWFPCSTCAGAIISAGIRKLFADKAAYYERLDDPRYGFELALQKLQEAVVEVRLL